MNTVNEQNNIKIEQTLNISIECSQSDSNEEIEALVKLYLHIPPESRKSILYFLSGAVIGYSPGLSGTVRTIMSEIGNTI